MQHTASHWLASGCVLCFYVRQVFTAAGILVGLAADAGQQVIPSCLLQHMKSPPQSALACLIRPPRLALLCCLGCCYLIEYPIPTFVVWTFIC